MGVVGYDDRLQLNLWEHNSVTEFGCNFYLVEGGRGSDKRDAREGDLIANREVEYHIANEVISLKGGDSFSNKLWCWIFGTFEPFICLYQEKIVCKRPSELSIACRRRSKEWPDE